MNHQKIYKSIIQKAKSENRNKLNKINPIYVYYENHHILPRCLNGGEEKENKVLLTAKEHFVCHKLLTYIYPGNYKIIYGYYRMIHSRNGNYIKSSRDYVYLKELISNTPIPKEIRDKISNKLQGIIRSNEFKEKQRQSHKGKNLKKFNYNEYIKNNRKGKTLKDEMIKKYGEDEGIKRYEQWIENMSVAKLGKKQSQTQIDNRRKSLTRKKRSEKAKESIKLSWIKRKGKQFKNLKS